MKTRTIEDMKTEIYNSKRLIIDAYQDVQFCTDDYFTTAVKNYAKVLWESRAIASNIRKELKRKEGMK